MLKELISSIAANFKERASSPLLGSYSIAALACNWMSLVVLLTSTKSGTALVEEIIAVSPGLTQGLLYPLIFATVFSLTYPTAKAAIATFNTKAKIMELRSEYQMEELREKISMKKNDIESVISALLELSSSDRIGYHDLKRIQDVLPKPEDLQIKSG